MIASVSKFFADLASHRTERNRQRGERFRDLVARINAGETVDATEVDHILAESGASQEQLEAAVLDLGRASDAASLLTEENALRAANERVFERFDELKQAAEDAAAAAKQEFELASSKRMANDRRLDEIGKAKAELLKLCPDKAAVERYRAAVSRVDSRAAMVRQHTENIGGGGQGLVGAIAQRRAAIHAAEAKGAAMTGTDQQTVDRMTREIAEFEQRLGQQQQWLKVAQAELAEARADCDQALEAVLKACNN